MTVLLFLGAMADLALPAIMADIVNKGVAAGDTGYILHKGLLMLVTAIGGICCAVIAGFLTARTALGFSRNLRESLFTKISGFSMHEFDAIGTSSLITRSTNDVSQVQSTLGVMMTMMVRAPIMCVGGIIMAVSHDPGLSMVFAAAIPVLVIIISVVMKTSIPLFRLMQKKIDSLNKVLREQLTGIRVVRAFTMEERETERFDGANRGIADTGITLAGIMAFMMSLMPLIMSLTSVAIVWFGAIRVDTGKMQTGDVMAFIQYGVMILFSLMMLSMMLIMLPRAQASAERINAVFSLEPSIIDPDSSEAVSADLGTVEFKDVFFRYLGAEENALCGISFTAKPGTVTAIVGSTGSGKSTLINLIPRFYDVQGGCVLVDGVDVRRMKQQDLRNKIGYVPQKAVLFTGSVKDNILFGTKDKDLYEAQKAAEVAQASEFIDKMENKYEAFIAQGGKNLSGGQKQRMSIARAVSRKPGIYIFDDSFSALDFRTDAALRAALKQETEDSTVIIVAQRVATIMDADNIIVLDEGNKAGEGTHAELMKNCAVYREIVYSQLSEEELA